MILIDRALQARQAAGRPVRAGIVGAGRLGHRLVNQIVNFTPGIEVSAIANRTVERAAEAYRSAGRQDVSIVETPRNLDAAIFAGKAAVAADAMLLARSEIIDVMVDVTGAVEFGAQLCLEAFRHGKDVVLANAEVDATVGPILQEYAKKSGVILSACDGDEPGIQMNLYRWVKGLGLQPRVIGNVKGLQDPYRTPATQKELAERFDQNPSLCTSAADGTKLSFEQAIVANATGFKVRTRGMSRGREYRGDVRQMGQIYGLDELRSLGGIVDYVVGTPLTKVYLLAEHPDPVMRQSLNLYHMGEGPLYSFFVPYHLVHFDMPNSIARAVLFRDSVAEPLGGPAVEVCAVAKQDLKAGTVLDNFGMYMTYGEAVNVEEMSSGRYLPEGLVEGCKLKRNISRDCVITYGDVDLPCNRIADRLRAEQYRRFRGETWLEELLQVAA